MRRHFVLVIWMVVWTLSCGSPKGPGSSTSGVDSQLPRQTALAQAVDGVGFTLSEATPVESEVAAIPRAQVVPLGDERLESVLRGAPQWGRQLAGGSATSIETERVRPRVKSAQVAQIERGRVPGVALGHGPLRVLRSSPRGDVPMATTVSVSFSEPMIGLTTHAAATQTAPVRLKPQPPGRWRWLGTDTVIFEAEGRLPMATEYRVTVPGGTPALSGAAFADEVEFKFATAHLLLEEYLVGELLDQGPFLFLKFNQRIDPEEVIDHIELAGSNETVELELAQIEDLPVDSRLARAVETGVDGTWILARHLDPLDSNTKYTLKLLRGASSSEGPRKTPAEQVHKFKSRDRVFRLTEHRCGYGDVCRPGEPWTFWFNQRLDEEAFDPAAISIEPPLAGLEIVATNHAITLHGDSRPGTDYRVNVPSALRDARGLALERSHTLTFSVGAAESFLGGVNRPTVVLPPSEVELFAVIGRNLRNIRTRVFATGPDSWRRYNAWRSDPAAGEQPPGKVIHDNTAEALAAADELFKIPVDLSALLESDARHGIVWITADSTDPADEELEQDLAVWVQLSGLRVQVLSDEEQLLAWVTQVGDGQPVAGAQVDFLEHPSSKPVQTDADGLARLRLPKKKGKSAGVLAVRWGAESVFAAAGDSLEPGDLSAWDHRRSTRRARCSINTDRGVYRPGQTVRLHGWMRFFENTVGSDLSLPKPDERKYSWKLRLPRSDQALEGSLKLSQNGGFDLAVPLPEEVDLGWTRLVIATPDGRREVGSVSFDIAEYRRPKYEVAVKATAGDHVLGDAFQLTARALYYTGGPVSDSGTEWQVSSEETRYAPPGHGRYHFGRHYRMWGPRRPGGVELPERVVQTMTGTTNARGLHSVQVTLEDAGRDQPALLKATASVMDLNRQAWSDTRDVMVHPSHHYLGMRSPSGLVAAGQPIPVEWIVTSVDGEQLPDVPVQMSLFRIESVRSNGQWSETRIEVGTCDGTSTLVPAQCALTPPQPGLYLVVGTVTDHRGRVHRTELHFYVTGPNPGDDPFGSNGEVTMVPDRAGYAVGDTARVLVTVDRYPATGLLTVGRSGLVESRMVRLSGPSEVIEVPITDSHHPEMHLGLRLTGADGQRFDHVPSLRIPVANPTRDLAVAVQPGNASPKPGANTEVAVTVKDAGGEPVRGAEVALFVVDEAALALTNHAIHNPAAVFLNGRSEGIVAHPVFPDYEVPDIREFSTEFGWGYTRGAGSLASGRISAQAGFPQMRSDFRALAVFRANVKTDADGRVRVAFRMPDSLTRYRVVALAASGADRFGTAQSSITAGLPLMVRPAPPRFAHLDDRFELPVVLHNTGDQPLEVEIAGRARGISLDQKGADSAGFRTTVPARGRLEVPFAATATAAGPAQFQFVARSNASADGYAGGFPVQLPTREETFATFGVIDKGAVRHQVEPPAGVHAQLGGLEVVVSSSQLESLTGALVALVDYPYGCAEQIASRLLAAVSMSDVARHLESDRMLDPDAFRQMIGDSIERLQKLQRSDGGFGFWPGSKKSNPYLSIHATHALARARNAEFSVSDGTFNRALRFVSRLASGEVQQGKGPASLSVQAYALYALQIAGLPEIKHAAPLLAGRPIEEFPLEALGWLLTTFVEAGQEAEVRRIVAHLNNQLVETAQTAQFKTGYTEGAQVILHSDRRSDAVITEALVDADPYNTALPKLVEGLLGARRSGSWATTQENAFALMAIKNYFDSFVSRHPHFDARVWRGDELILEERYRRRTPRQARVVIDMADLLAKGSPTDLVIEKDGVQRMYYRLALRYAQKEPSYAPVSHGFTVSRSYQSIDHGDDVVQLDDGRWRIRAGARVRVRVDLVVPIRRHHVALVDRLPAGLEAINPHLAVSAEAPPQLVGGRWLPYAWYDHQNLRDDRAEAFAGELAGGVYSYSYTARATTPGTFVAPAALAEEMYNPETFGAGAAEIVVVER